MRVHVVRIATVVATFVAGTVVATAAASAASGPGTFTRITTPAHEEHYHYNASPGAANRLTVSGTASADVTSVDIDCVFYNPGAIARPFADAVPVTNGKFTADATVPSRLAQCRLRAIPTDVNVESGYLGAFAGPLFYMSAVGVVRDGGKPVSYLAVGEQHDGFAETTDAGDCGVIAMATVEPPSMAVHGTPGEQGCAFGLPRGNLAATGSPITVDGHNAYLPAVVADYLRGDLALTLAQSKLTVTSHRFGNGDLTMTESAPLMRCSGDDTYPPSSTSCPSLVNTGVTFRRVVNLFRGDHQVRMRDAFVSTDAHRHTVRPRYQAKVQALPYGAPGYRFPAHGPAFHQARPNEIVTGFGSGAGTLLGLADIHAAAGDPLADTFGFTWSRPPQKVQFSQATPLTFAMPYRLTVPAGGAAHLGFAETEHLLVTDTSKLASVAANETVTRPTIASPKHGATVRGRSTTVKGSVTLGANGLPTSVTVNGHRAHLTRVSSAKETYAVTFTESFGRHKLTVTARDVAGNISSRSVTVRNVRSRVR